MTAIKSPAGGGSEHFAAPVPHDTGLHERWYAVNTQPHAEARSRLNLERQGFACFFPVYKASCRVRGRQIQRLKPLFSNYIFLRMDVSQTRWRAIDSTYGVRAIVKQGDRPLPLPAGCVEALVSRSGEDGVFSFASQLSAGTRVEFLNGPFAGFIGVLEALDSRGRIRVLLELMGRSSTIQSTVADIAPAPDARDIVQERRIVRPQGASMGLQLRAS